MHGHDLFVLSAVLVAGFVCQWLAWRVKLPSILFLLLVGIVAGPVTGLLRPDDVFGDLLPPVVSLAVGVILYEGSLTLKFAEIRGHGAVVRNLVSIGVLTTWVVATLAANFFLGWDWYLAALFGAIVTVSGPTVIMPLLRAIRPNRSLSSVIRWEGILVDPLGAVLAVLVFDFIVADLTAATTAQVYATFGLILGAGLGFGASAGYAFGIVLRKHWLPDYLRDYAALALVIFVFSAAEYVAAESGLLAVTVMGIWQANMRDVELEDILDFKESLTLVLVAGLFIILAARVDLESITRLGLGAVGVLLALQFFAGPLRAFLSSIGSELSWRERAYLGWLFPRGIVAAAVSAIFALRLEDLDMPGADALVPMVFIIIVGTVVMQSLSGSLLARLLGVQDPDPTGVLIVGANPAALLFAEALHGAGHRVLVASMGWDGISKARMAGLPVYYGSAVSGYADRHLDLMGLGNLLALSHLPGLNELACVRFRYEFGRESVYTVTQHTEDEHEKYQISGETGGRLLFAGRRSMDDMLEIAEQDVKIRTTEITEAFSFQDYRARYPARVVLFVTEAAGRLRFPVDLEEMRVPAGSRVTALVPADEEEARQKKRQAEKKEAQQKEKDRPA